MYLERASIQSLKWYKASGRIPYHDAVEALQGAKEVLGQSISIGPAYVITKTDKKFRSVRICEIICMTFSVMYRWTTHWFKCDMTVPSSWAGKQVRFRWDSNSEAMVSDSIRCCMIPSASVIIILEAHTLYNMAFNH